MAIAKRLNKDCNEPFMFACMVKTGCVTACKAGSGGALFTLLINLIDKVMESLGDGDEIKCLLAKALQSYLDETYEGEPEPVETVETGKPVSEVDSERVINQIDSVL